MARKFQRVDKRYVSILVVHVPDIMGLIDMMRYDRCCPLTEDESRKIWALLGQIRGGNDATASDHVIRLMRFAPNNLPATEGRWRSFGCRVLDERSPDEHQLADAEILNLAKISL